VLAASIIRAMMEAARTSETSVNVYQTTRRNNPEDSHLRTHHRENLKSYLISYLLQVTKLVYDNKPFIGVLMPLWVSPKFSKGKYVLRVIVIC
jgi:hypothetical protein